MRSPLPAGLLVLVCAGAGVGAGAGTCACVFDARGLAAADAARRDGEPSIREAGLDRLVVLDLGPDRGPPAPAPAPGVAGGFVHGCALRAGELWCWGGNSFGQLGTGDTGGRLAPARVGASSAWAHLAPGGQANHTCALESDGALWCWGRNQEGQLGLGTSGGGTDKAQPTRVSSDVWGAVARGQRHTCAVTATGELWCWGYNGEGHLGLGDHADRLLPTRVGSGASWQRASPGDGHTCAVQSDGSLWCWGRNTQGQLGLGPGASTQHTLPRRVGSAQWRAVAAGQLHTCGIQTDGSLWCWGDNGSGQLGLGDSVTRDQPTRVGAGSDWAALATSWFHACAARQDGGLWCWGRNDEGQLGQGDQLSRSTPTQVPGTGWIDVAVSRFHTCGVRGDGTVLCTGRNDEGQLGLGDTLDQSTMIGLTFP